MDARTFDRWTAAISRRPSRRSALRLLTGSLVAGLLPLRGTAPTRAAQRPDRDGDGLYDDDETDVYGTNPDVSDTDGDGVGDGEEIYNRDQGLGGPADPLTPDGGAPAPAPAADPCAGLTNCGGVCVDVLTDQNNCGSCGRVCGASESCFGAACLASSQGGYVDPCTQMYAGGRLCNGTCVDLLVDPTNCGACGRVCTGPGYSGACVWGGCWRN